MENQNELYDPGPQQSPWQKLRERTESELRAKYFSDKQRIQRAVKERWNRTKIRRNWKQYGSTDWIRNILKSKPHPNSINFKIKENLIREVNQYMLDILDCLITDAIPFKDAETMIRYERFGLKMERVKVHIKSKLVEVERVPILVEINIPLIVGRINRDVRAKQGLRPIKEGVIRKSLQGLEQEGFIGKVGGKRGMKGPLRMIGSYYVRQTLVINPSTKEEMEIPMTGKAYFWGASQSKVRERLARLKPGK